MRNSLLPAVGVGISLLALAACGGDGGTGPSPTTSSVTVRDQGSGTIFIGSERQFEAMETLSDGSMRPAQSATWRSDAPNVATVSAGGRVTAVAAGEATITAEVNPIGSLRIRVFPSFGGAWRGTELTVSCIDSGVFAGLCADPDTFTAGEAFQHDSSFTQQDASVSAVLDMGGGSTAAATGQVSVGGDLAMLPATVMPPLDPLITVVVQNWLVRSDVPSQLTGSYEAVFSSPGVPGSVILGLQLQNVGRTSATTGVAPAGGPNVGTAHSIANALLQRLGK